MKAHCPGLQGIRRAEYEKEVARPQPHELQPENKRELMVLSALNQHSSAPLTSLLVFGSEETKIRVLWDRRLLLCKSADAE
jgi:hypothetical protein